MDAQREFERTVTNDAPLLCIYCDAVVELEVEDGTKGPLYTSVYGDWN